MGVGVQSHRTFAAPAQAHATHWRLDELVHERPCDVALLRVIHARPELDQARDAGLAYPPRRVGLVVTEFVSHGRTRRAA